MARRRGGPVRHRRDRTGTCARRRARGSVHARDHHQLLRSVHDARRAGAPPSARGGHRMTKITVDVDTLRSEIEKTYTEVSTEPAKDFIFPTGRSWAEDLGYPQPELLRVPEPTVESFAGVANPHSLGRIEEGAKVHDLGCGAGTDLLIAA